MKKYVLACDLDGTLIKCNEIASNKRTVLAKDKEEVHNFINLGHLFVVSTGRDKLSAFKFLEQEKIIINNGYFITSNGAEVYNSNKERLFIKSLEIEIVKKTVDLFLEFNKEHYLECNVFDGSVNQVLLNSEDVINFNNSNGDNIVSVCISSRRKDIEDVKQFYLRAKDIVKEASISMNNWFVDILPLNISKASALEFIIGEYVSEKNFQLVAIGDSWNDIPMFEIADRSYTFNNSPNDVKEAATYLVDHVYECLNDLLHA